MEEQNATTNEMARNVSEAAQGSGEITSNMEGVAQAAESTSRGATDTLKAAQHLVHTSSELRRLVEQFKINASESSRGKGAAATHEQSRAARAGYLLSAVHAGSHAQLGNGQFGPECSRLRGSRKSLPRDKP